MSFSSLTCSLTLSLSSWPSFCLLGIKFPSCPSGTSYTHVHRPPCRRWGWVASDEPRTQMALPSGALHGGCQHNSLRGDKGCSTGKQWRQCAVSSQKDTLQKSSELIVSISRYPDQSLTWRGTRGKVGLLGGIGTLCFAWLLRNRHSEIALASAPLWRFCYRNDNQGPGLSRSYEFVFRT